MKNKFYSFAAAVIILTVVLSVILVLYFPGVARIFISALISVILLIYLLYYLAAGHEFRSNGSEEAVTYMEWDKKLSFSHSYVHDSPVTHELCFYRENGFIKARCNQTDRFLRPFDIISYTDKQKQVHTCMILPGTKGHMYNKWKYIAVSVLLAGTAVLAVSCSVSANQKYKSAFDDFFAYGTETVMISHAGASAPYQQNEAFEDFHFILTVCQGSDGTAEFLKLFCINGKSYHLNVITLNQNLMINGRRFCDDVNTALISEDYSGLSAAVTSYFKICPDMLVVLSYEEMCRTFDAPCISLTADEELYQMRYMAEHRQKLDEADGIYNYNAALDVIERLRDYTEQCIISGENGTMWLEQTVSELENDLLYSVLCSIADRNYHLSESLSCLVTDMSEKQYQELYHIINYRPSTFLNQFRSAENRIVLPYLSACEIVFDDENQISAYVPEGYLDSRIIRELYYTILRK